MRAPVIAASRTGPDLVRKIGPRGPSGGEDGGAACFDNVLEAKQRFLCAARAGAADGFVSKEPECARDELAIEALADDDGCAGASEIKRAGQNALVPEAEDLGACALAEGKWGGAQFGDCLEAPGAADKREQRPNEARDNGQNEGGGAKLFAGCGGHWVDFTARTPRERSERSQVDRASGLAAGATRAPPF